MEQPRQWEGPDIVPESSIINPTVCHISRSPSLHEDGILLITASHEVNSPRRCFVLSGSQSRGSGPSVGTVWWCWLVSAHYPYDSITNMLTFSKGLVPLPVPQVASVPC